MGLLDPPAGLDADGATPEPRRGSPRGLRSLAQLCAAGLALLGLLLWASASFPVVWDETIYFDFADSVRAWGAKGFPFDAESLAKHWEYNRVFNPHPPVLKSFSAMTSAWFEDVLPFPLPYRLPYLAFIAFGMVVSGAALSRRFGPAAAAAAIAAAFLQPRVFGELMTAATDGAVATAWLTLPILLWAWEREQRPRRLWALAFLVVQVCGAGTKITGLLAALPLAGVCVLTRRWHSLALVAGSAAVAMLTAALWSPALWAHPVRAVLDMLVYPFTRAEAPIAAYYLGQLLPDGMQAPWHHFAIMTAVTVPAVLLLALPGLALVRDERRLLALLAGPLAFWIVLEHLPGVPRHDGVRQFIAFYPLLGLAAWFGWEAVLTRVSAVPGPSLRKRAVAALRFLPAAWLWATLLAAHPFELSYYNAFIGGVRGAERNGLELSYWLEPVRKTLGWINREARLESRIVLYPNWPQLLARYQREGLLRRDLIVLPWNQREHADYAIVSRRRTHIDDRLYATMPARFQVHYGGVSLAKVIAIQSAP